MTRRVLSKLVTPRRHFDPGMGSLACVASLRERIVRRIYDLCGRGPHYWLVMALAQGAASVVVASSNVLLAASFFDPPGWKIRRMKFLSANVNFVSVADKFFVSVLCESWGSPPPDSQEPPQP